MYALLYTEDSLTELLGVFTTLELTERAKNTYISNFRDEEYFSIQEVSVDRVANLPEGKKLYCHHKFTIPNYESITEQIEPFEEGNMYWKGNVDFTKGEIINQIVYSPAYFSIFVWAGDEDEAKESAEKIFNSFYG